MGENLWQFKPKKLASIYDVHDVIYDVVKNADVPRHCMCMELIIHSSNCVLTGTQNDICFTKRQKQNGKKFRIAEYTYEMLSFKLDLNCVF